MSESKSTAPYGFCQCGCGERTSVAAQTQTSEGIRKGEHRRFVAGHWSRVRPPKDFGRPPLCKCGCGEPVEHRPGKWLKYAKGHYHRARKASHPDFTDTDPFWSWFAGFTDGEGCFGITVSQVGRKKYPQPFFKITLRDDDKAILEEIRDRLGCGRVRTHHNGYGTSKPQSSFLVSAVADCVRLVQVFELHPLRAKKARDFEVWSQAVAEKAENGTSPRLWTLRDELIEGRRYV